MAAILAQLSWKIKDRLWSYSIFKMVIILLFFTAEQTIQTLESRCLNAEKQSKNQFLAAR